MAPIHHDPERGRTAELWVRSHAPFGVESTRTDVLDSLESLASDDVLDEVRARLWGKRVGLTTMAARTKDGTEILDRVDAFRKWAHERDASLGGFFPTREISSQVVDEAYRVQELPVLTLAEFRGGELTFVTPSVVEGSIVTVEDRVATLEAATDDEGEQRTGGRDSDPIPTGGR